MRTDLNAAEEALFAEKERAEVTLNSIGDAVVCADVLGRTTFLNIVAEKLTGWPRQEAIGRPVADVLRMLDGTSRTPIQDPLQIAIAENKPVYLPPDVVLIHRDGSHIPIEDTVAPIHDSKGQVTGAVIVFRDVTAARAMALQLAYSANHDALTGLPNRLLLQDRIGQAIGMAAHHASPLAILFLDLDRFKHINDSLGHSIGDRLLVSVAERLSHSIRDTDTVSRQGGDEFVVLLAEVGSVERLAVMARRIVKAVSTAYAIDKHKLRITASMGISVYPDDGIDAETLIKNADTAMYQAKENGRQTFRFFEPAMNVRAVERQSIEEHLRRALEGGEFELYYQPKVNLESGAITGAEALLRWNHPTLGTVLPAQFIPIAEESGLILPIGSWVLLEACRLHGVWQRMGLPAISIAVNVSAMEVGDAGFLKRIFATLRETDLDPRLLELELTESVLMKRGESAAAILQALKARGIRVAIDDFGTGYSSLSYLQTLPVDALKLDQSFVRQIVSGEETPIITAVISMAHSLKLRVIAEGIETQTQLAFLRKQSCDEGQGYYFSYPLPAAEFAALLEAGALPRVPAEPS